jgi:hypothetical protein
MAIKQMKQNIFTQTFLPIVMTTNDSNGTGVVKFKKFNLSMAYSKKCIKINYYMPGLQAEIRDQFVSKWASITGNSLKAEEFESDYNGFCNELREIEGVRD